MHTFLVDTMPGMPEPDVIASLRSVRLKAAGCTQRKAESVDTVSGLHEGFDTVRRTLVAALDTHLCMQDLPAEPLRPLPAGELLYGPPRFWTTFHDMLVDVYTVSVGPEKRAFQIALWLAIFNQARAALADAHF